MLSTSRYPPKKQNTVYDISGAIFEIFWKEADLTGQSLFLESGFMGGRDAYLPSALAYIRLEPIHKITPPGKRDHAVSLFYNGRWPWDFQVVSPFAT